MNARARNSVDGRFILRCCAFMLCTFAAATPALACPKLLMGGGVFIRKQTNAEQATYWGRTVGVQGFLVNEVMRDWDTDVGTDADSNLWKLVRQFQSIYSDHGVTDNFIKVGLYTVHDWGDAWKNEAAAKNFAHAAALAKYAGLKGIAVDLEPYQPTWGGSPDLAGTVQQEGRAIGQAMHDAYPDMTLIIEKDGLHQAFQLHQPIAPLADPQATPPDSSKRYHGGYALAVPFLRGLLSVNWSHVVIATEETYKDFDIAKVVQQTSSNYAAFLGDSAVWSNLSVAPGLWPLGLSKWDKSARMSPAQFKQQLDAGFQTAPDYVWIYAFGSAWQTDGPYGPGPVTANFQQYVDAVHQAVANCGAGDSSPAPHDSSPAPHAEPTAHIVPPRANGESAQPVRPVPHFGAMQPVGTLPQIRVLRAAGRPYRSTEIQ